ncbi:hemolysin family protein [Nocardiopsis tropica]|jgi:putative hemolysin|uniref:Hemolysin family protein n=1 Tax=Nocardiopsis tropica TaxID=109330 RepID=A0ABU7L011_9ACTN|nr:hemolysin family protein [Nocardiopsis umidischolae]MEE2054860.1 hemolysin family protein [Nocardiopsis umidischolae]
MEGYEAQIGLVLVLVVVNAVFAGSEIALITLREGQLRRLEASGPGGRAVARLARDPNRFLATIQIGITLAGFLASATAAVSLARPLVEPLGFLGSYASPVSVVLVTVVLTFVTLVLGELAPKRIAMQRAEPWALLVARPINALAVLSRPAVWLLGVSTDLVVRLGGADPGTGKEEVSEEELREMISARGDMTPEQRTILSGAFEITDRTLRQVLVPRRDVDTVPASLPAGEAALFLAERGHSRAPVVTEGDVDDVVGVVHWSDLLRGEGDAGALAREPLLLPVSLSVSQALHRMTGERQQMAVVIGESGAVDGIVSLEDLLEEVVGEIYDETDADERVPARVDGGALRVPGTYPVHDLDDLGVVLASPPEGSYVTVAGMVLVVLGHIPEGPGESVDLGGWTATVTEADGRVVGELLLVPDA